VVDDDDDFAGLPLPVLYLEGPTFILHRAPHFPHFLEEISDALTWLARQNESYFEHVLVTEGGGACVSFNSYVPGLWAPTGSPLTETLQYLMLQTISKGIVFTWGLRPRRTVCFGSPTGRNIGLPGPLRGRQQPHTGPSSQYFQHPMVCPAFRSRISDLLRVPLTPARGPERRRLRVLVLQRVSGGRVVTNLHEILSRPELQAPHFDVHFVELGKGATASAAQQMRQFVPADILVGHHGAAISLSILMAPGSLVIEILNYRTYCRYFDDLFVGCGLFWERLFYQYGNRYKGILMSDKCGCQGSNSKDSRDDAPVDMDALVSKIMRYQNGLSVAEQEPEEVLECCPTCRSCGLLPHEVALVTPLKEYEIL
jgi:hypothetical protein